MRALRWATIILLLATALPLPALADSGGTSASFGRDVVVAEGERLVGDLLAFGGNVHLMPGAVVDGNVMTIGSAVTVEGRVEGDVVAMGGRVTLQSSAAVIGDLIVFGDLTRERGALVRGSVIEGLEAAAHFPGITRATVVPPRQGPGPPPSQRPLLPLALCRRPCAGPRGWAAASAFWWLRCSWRPCWQPCCGGAPPHQRRDVHQLGPQPGDRRPDGGPGGTADRRVRRARPRMCGAASSRGAGGGFPRGALLGWAAAGQIVGQFLAPRLRAPAHPLVETVLGTTVITIATMIPCPGPALGLGLLCWAWAGPSWATPRPCGLARPRRRARRERRRPRRGPPTRPGSADAAQKGDTKPLDTTRWPFVPDDEDPGPHQ